MTPLRPSELRLAVFRRATERFQRKRYAVGSPLPRRLIGLMSYQLDSYYFHQPPRWRIRLRARTAATLRQPPDFAAIGPVRSGTTSLTDWIFQHPCVALPLAKEYSGTEKAHLLAHMPKRVEVARIRAEHGTCITGYSTPLVPLIDFPFVARSLNADMKFVLLLRNPVDRALSHFRWECHRRLWRAMAGHLLPQVSLMEWIHIDQRSLRAGGSGLATLSGSHGLLGTGIYAPFVATLLSLFDRDKCLLLTSEGLFSQSAATMARVFDFLALPPIELDIAQDRSRNESRNTPAEIEAQVTDEAKRLLQEFYRPYNAMLYDLIGMDLGWQ